MYSTLLKLIFHTLLRNELRSVKFNNLFATRRYSAKITIKKKFKDHTKDVTIIKLFELFNQFHKKCAKSTFYFCIRTQCNETKLITERERFHCVYRNF